MKTIDRHMIKQLLRASLIAILALSLPVILISLSTQVPVFSVPAALLWPLFLAVSGIIIFHMMPVLVASAIIWSYVRFWSEGTVVTLFMAGRSTLAVAAPALLVAVAAMLAGYALSGFLKPMSEKTIHDVLHTFRRDINLNLLETGKFNKFDNGRIMIFIKEKIKENHFKDIYISEYSYSDKYKKKIKSHYYSKYAVITGDKGNKYITLIDGSTINDNDGMRRIDFERAIWQPDTSAAKSLRNRIFLDELNIPAFFGARALAFEKTGTARLWLREAVKRFVIPLLALTHTALGLVLLNFFCAITGSRNRSGLIITFLCGVMFAIHLPIIFFTEAISIAGMPLVVLVVALVGLQLVAAIALFAGTQKLWLQSTALSLMTYLFGLFPARALPSAQFSHNSQTK